MLPPLLSSRLSSSLQSSQRQEETFSFRDEQEECTRLINKKKRSTIVEEAAGAVLRALSSYIDDGWEFGNDMDIRPQRQNWQRQGRSRS